MQSKRHDDMTLCDVADFSHFTEKEGEFCFQLSNGLAS